MFFKLLLKRWTPNARNGGVRFLSDTTHAPKVENVLVLGSGLMGSGIAQSCATVGKFASVTLYDVSQDALDKARHNILQSLTKLKEKKRIDIAGSAEETAARITYTNKLVPVSDRNLLIIEAVPEILELKQQIFEKLSSEFGSTQSTIFATNTSSLPCSKIHARFQYKERFAGLHFFNPVPLMKLVEIARTVKTNAQVVDSLRQFVLDIDHVPVECKDNAGFIVNRLLVPYMNEALAMLQRGDASFRDIDTAMKLGANYPMGPFELMDYVGLDTHVHVAQSFQQNDPTIRVFRSELLEQIVANGHLGVKSGQGFYDYSNGKRK